MEEASYCLCGQSYNPNIFMIQCDSCKDWFHSSCVNFQEHTAIEIERYHCPRCVPLYGPSVFKPYRNWHRYDYWDENGCNKPVQTGTAVFIRELRARHFQSEGEVVIHMRGQQLTENLLQTQGFNNPIVIDGKDGLDMTIPPENFSLYDVEAYIGGDVEMDVIDVTRQADIRMKLRDYVAYFNSLSRTRVFNVVSLEFSNTGLSRMVEAPLVARKLDWVNAVWPRDYPLQRPHVQKYCLMSVKDSYTDFHIDFGGTSVWYHVLRGEKIFFFIKPTPANLTLYQQWMTSSNQSETFFGDQVDQCYKCTLRQGQTMLIPTGWIHAVLTPIDSLVFGGNFLHSLNIPMQLQVYDIEKKVKTTEKFLYPHFETINWFAAQKLLQKITQVNAEDQKCPNTLLVGLKSLQPVLKQWNSDKDYNTNTREQIPFTINAAKLLKDIAKEVRHAERYITALNPPKPERESKRKRRKPVNKDFVEFSSSSRSLDYISQDYALPPKLTVPKVQPQPPPPQPAPQLEPQPYPYSLMDHEMMLGDLDHAWTSDLARPEQTTAVHRGGTVLKIKLGTKDLLPIDHSNEAGLSENDLLLPNLEKSIYDFNDDDERDEDCYNLSIDENPKRSLKNNSSHKAKSTAKSKKGHQQDSEVDVEGDLPKNGIESLLKASALTNKFIGNEGGRTSPSTQDAIAGMLSIGQSVFQTNRGTPRSKKHRTSSPYSEEEDINNVHQDEEYRNLQENRINLRSSNQMSKEKKILVYPSLDNSDDEDVHIFKPRGRSKVDEAWNPKARVGPLLPKMNRPAREGTKKQSVEKVLEAAAAKRATESPEKSPKRQYRRKKLKPKEKRPIPGTSTSSNSTSSSSTTKPRKGMKTVKQRLGKILKLHKMMH